jgi:microfibrillar-associated protein 1
VLESSSVSATAHSEALARESAVKEVTRRLKEDAAAVAEQARAAKRSMLNARDNMPDDTDGADEEGELRAWEIREMRRLHEAAEPDLARERERQDVERRRKLTDAERAREDAELASASAAGEPSGAAAPAKKASRYYHKGAFYMDEETLGKAEAKSGRPDVRRRDLSSAATGLEKELNTSLLPDFMQGKRYGVKHSSSRHSGTG